MIRIEICFSNDSVVLFVSDNKCSYLMPNNLLSDQQFGFRQHRSTATSLCQLIDDLLTNKDEGKFTGIVYLDLKKAFYTVDHEILISKLKTIGVSGMTLN